MPGNKKNRRKERQAARRAQERPQEKPQRPQRVIASQTPMMGLAAALLGAQALTRNRGEDT